VTYPIISNWTIIVEKGFFQIKNYSRVRLIFEKKNLVEKIEEYK
jgi:hypothetical protein